jgi:copper chaperone CopZ
MTRLSGTVVRCAALALWLVAASAPGRAEVQGMSLAVNGVVCPVCAHSINMGLRRMAGIKSVKVLMKSRVNVDITPQAGAWVEPARIFRQISLVGYRARPDEMKLRLRGAVTRSGDRFLLTLTDAGSEPLRFFLGTSDVSGKRRAEIDLALEDLKNGMEPNGSREIAVEGFWRPPSATGQPASLLLTHVPVSQAPADGRAQTNIGLPLPRRVLEEISNDSAE